MEETDKPSLKKRNTILISVFSALLVICVVIISIYLVSARSSSSVFLGDVAERGIGNSVGVAIKGSAADVLVPAAKDDASKKEASTAPVDATTQAGSQEGQPETPAGPGAVTGEVTPTTPSSPAPSSGGTTTPSGSGASASTPSSPPPTPPAPSTITVSVYVDSSRAASFGYASCMASTNVTLSPGASVYDALCATGVSVGGSSSYVKSINGLAEFSCGAGSGWLYFVNGTKPGFGCGSYSLSGGEDIVWIYSLDFGNDV